MYETSPYLIDVILGIIGAAFHIWWPLLCGVLVFRLCIRAIEIFE